MDNFVGFDFFLFDNSHEVVAKLTKFQIVGKKSVVMES